MFTVKKCNMDTIEIVRSVIKNPTESSNKELIISLEYLNNDFEQTKTSIINLTKHLECIPYLKKLLIDKHVLIVRDQNFTEETLINFASNFGELCQHPTSVKKDSQYPQIIRLEKPLSNLG